MPRNSMVSTALIATLRLRFTQLDALALECVGRGAFVLACLAMTLWLWRTSALSVREKKAAVVAGIVHLILSTLIDFAAVNQGVYRYLFSRQLLWGIAFDLHLGWAALWGTGLCLAWVRIQPARRILFLAVVIAATFALDVLALKSGRVFVALKFEWWIWDLCAMVLLAAAALTWFKMVCENRALALRAGFYALSYFALFYVILPALIIELGEKRAFDPLGTLQPWHWGAFALASLPGLWAAVQFATSGQGTPLPLDPTRSLVTHGIYAYVRNPMQLSGLLAALCWAVATGSVFAWIYVLDLIVLFVAIKRFEENELTERFGEAYVAYAGKVRKWVPMRKESAQCQVPSAKP